ncbi:MAG: hypothetical protein AABW64_02120 [Nanoarchaeota archaeon]
MTKGSCIRIEFLERESVRECEGSVRRFHTFYAGEADTLFGRVDIPLESENFPLHEELSRTEDGTKWFRSYQEYYRLLFRSDEFVSKFLYAAAQPLKFQRLRYFADPLSPFAVPNHIPEQKDEGSRAHIRSLDDNLAAIVDITFAKTNSSHPANILAFHDVKGYVCDAQKKVQTYRAEDSDDRKYWLLGRLQRRSIKKGSDGIDWLAGVLKRNPAYKLQPPLDHWIEQSLTSQLPASSPYHEKTPLIRLKFVPG